VSHRAIFDAAAILLTPAGLLLAALFSALALKLFASDEPRNDAGRDLQDQDLADDEDRDLEPHEADARIAA
jgi:hypothetical protein